MAKLTERKVIMLTFQEAEWLEALANVNTSGNESELFRRLLRRAIVNPDPFGLIGVRDFLQALALEIA